MTRDFTFERATKNTLRYREDPTGDEREQVPEMVGIIYIQKSVFAPNAPQRIRVTVEEVR